MERAGRRLTTGEIEDRRLFGRRCAGGHLLEDQRREVPWMQAVADLMAHAVETDVFQRAFFTPRVEPEGKDSLIGFTELSGSCHDAAAVDPDGEVKGMSILHGQLLGGEFGGSIQ